LACVAGALGLYGLWAVRRDARRGQASARGLGFDRASQPKRYRALMTFNAIAVAMLFVDAVAEVGLFVWRTVLQ